MIIFAWRGFIVPAGRRALTCKINLMRKIILFMHTTLDGFVAGPKGEMDWIKLDDEIFDYAGARTNDSDTAIYGRVTFQMMDSYWPTAGDKPSAGKHDIDHSRWYNSVEKIVLSRTLQTDNPKVRVIGNDVAREITKLKQSAGKDILIFGSPSAAHFLMQEDLIDEFWLFVNPVLIGEGIPLFKDIKNRILLKLVGSTAFSCGVIGLHYNHAG
jgi:dihydrofolate reductase